METTLDEIADGIDRISTYLSEVAPPLGFTMNRLLIVDDEPLFHAGPRAMFPLVTEAVAKVVPVERCDGSLFATLSPTNAVR